MMFHICLYIHLGVQKHMSYFIYRLFDMHTCIHVKLWGNFHSTADSNALLEIQMNSVICVHSCKAIKSEKSFIRIKCSDMYRWIQHINSHTSEMYACYHITFSIAVRCVQFDRWMKHTYLCMRTWFTICICSEQHEIPNCPKKEERTNERKNIPRTSNILYCSVPSRLVRDLTIEDYNGFNSLSSMQNILFKSQLIF